jgi:hypothetical protein
VLDVFGGQSRNRTTDTRIFKRLLLKNHYLTERNSSQNQALKRTLPQKNAVKRSSLLMASTEQRQTERQKPSVQRA